MALSSKALVFYARKLSKQIERKLQIFRYHFSSKNHQQDLASVARIYHKKLDGWHGFWRALPSQEVEQGEETASD